MFIENESCCAFYFVLCSGGVFASDEVAKDECEGVELWEHCRYEGVMNRFLTGKHNLVGIGKDEHGRELDWSGIKLGKCCKAVGYENNDFTGKKVEFTDDNDCLVYIGFNDVMSSIEITDICSRSEKKARNLLIFRLALDLVKDDMNDA